MTTSSSQFLISVADVFMRDTVSDTVVLRGTAALSTAFKQAMSSEEIRGGFGNTLQFLYQHTKKIDVSIDMANWDESVFALNNGTTISNGLQDYYFEENITLTGGAGVTSNTPVGSVVYVQPISGGAIQTINSTGTAFTVSGGGTSTYRVGYKYSVSVDSIVIAADSIPAAYELILRAKVFTSVGQSAEMEIIIPQFRLVGSFDVSLSAAGASTTKIDGMSLADASNNYAYVYIKPIGATTVTYQAIAATPSAVSISSGAPTSQLTVYGLRGGLYSNVVVTTGCTYVSATTATCTIGASTGLITRVAAGSSVITVTHTASGKTDTVVVTSS